MDCGLHNNCVNVTFLKVDNCIVVVVENILVLVRNMFSAMTTALSATATHTHSPPPATFSSQDPTHIQLNAIQYCI